MTNSMPSKSDVSSAPNSRKWSNSRMVRAVALNLLALTVLNSANDTLAAQIPLMKPQQQILKQCMVDDFAAQHIRVVPYKGRTLIALTDKNHIVPSVMVGNDMHVHPLFTRAGYELGKKMQAVNLTCRARLGMPYMQQSVSSAAPKAGPRG